MVLGWPGSGPRAARPLARPWLSQAAVTKAHLEKHASECPNCFVIVDTTRKTLQVYKGMEPKAIPQDVEKKLWAALERKMAAES